MRFFDPATIPWVEKYRPTEFENIVLDSLNKTILTNIIETSYFPNLLFYGPPGTGKTTTIINLVAQYQKKNNQVNKELVIHLNASDERGIDTIRNQINQFVSSKNLFNKGMKFVILDEVDYMTDTAQQALRYLLQSYTENVRFCLICNYISRIDQMIQNEFVRLKFNQLPDDKIIKFITHISECEKLKISNENIRLIQKIYNSDIRSMINFMQSQQHHKNKYLKIIDSTVWDVVLNQLSPQANIPTIQIYNLIVKLSQDYNMDKKYIIKLLLKYIVRKYSELVTSDFLDFVESMMHIKDVDTSTYINYTIVSLKTIFKNSTTKKV